MCDSQTSRYRRTSGNWLDQPTGATSLEKPRGAFWLAGSWAQFRGLCPRSTKRTKGEARALGNRAAWHPARFGISDEIDTAARYRQRAEGLRQIASDRSPLGIRNHLLTVAEEYERQASLLEDIDATNVAMKREPSRG